MKSRIRSRWYRANEKPLESQNSSSMVSQTPIGEVSLSSDEFLKDDLNDEAAKKTSQNRPTRQQESNRERRPSRGPSDRDEKKFQKGGKSNNRRGENDKDSPNRERKRKDGTRSRSPQNSKPKSFASHPGPPKKSPTNKKGKQVEKSGVSKFLSKLFGA